MPVEIWVLVDPAGRRVGVAIRNRHRGKSQPPALATLALQLRGPLCDGGPTMSEYRFPVKHRTVRLKIALACAVAAFSLAVAIATGADGPEASLQAGASARGDQVHFTDIRSGGGTDATPGGGRRSIGDGVDDGDPGHETLPCTGPKAPVNFEVFSAGPAPGGLPQAKTKTVRRCDVRSPGNAGSRAIEGANYVSYIYGDCANHEGHDNDHVGGHASGHAEGCQPPLEIQSWPACERSMADYSFEGRPLAHRRLPKRDGAEVVEFELPIEPAGNRIEVYTGSATVIIFSIDQDLARKAVALLRSQEKGAPLATDRDALGGGGPERLAPPTDGSMEGRLSCEA